MAYNLATEQRAFMATNGQTGSVVIRYTGNAGEPPVSIEYTQSLSSAPSADYLRGIAINQLNVLNTTLTYVTSQIGIVPVTLDTTTPITPVASTFGAFVAATGPFTPGTTPTDIVTIFGSATRTITVNKITIATVQTTAGINAWKLIKRSSANTGGTSAALTRIPMNSVFPAATATLLQYSVNPTALGTALGNVWSGNVAAPSLTSVVNGCLEVPLLAQSPVTLTGVAQGLAVNFSGVALPSGLSVQVIIGWSEQ